MPSWVRYPMWDRWRDLTRFRVACEMALESYRNYVNGFPVVSDTPLVVEDNSRGSGFRCQLDEFKIALNDEQQLYRVLLPAYVALIEDLARDVTCSLLGGKQVARSQFTGMSSCGSIDEAAERWIADAAVELWGELILDQGGRDWSSIKGGKRAVVRTVTVRNLCAHGIPVYNQKAVNRIGAAAGTAPIPAAGDAIVLDRPAFYDHVATLRAFGRVLSDAVTNHAGAPV